MWQRKQAEALALQHLHKAATTPRSSDVDVNDMVTMEDVPIIDTDPPVVSALLFRVSRSLLWALTGACTACASARADAGTARLTGRGAETRRD